MALRRLFSSSAKDFSEKIYRICGIKPSRVAIYREALRHSSVNDFSVPVSKLKDNERLEFLGDAILDAVIAEVLFLRFPYQDEGFLTEMRTRIVNREQLAYLSEKLGIVHLMEIKPELMKNTVALKTIGSNALEALIGAIYLDKGYLSCRKFIIKRLLEQYMDMDKLMNTTISYKAVLLKWAQKQHKVVSWKHVQSKSMGKDVHEVSLLIDEEVISTEKNVSRKKAEELCCLKATQQLEIA